MRPQAPGITLNVGSTSPKTHCRGVPQKVDEEEQEEEEQEKENQEQEEGEREDREEQKKV